MESRSDGRTYRVRKLPSSVDKREAASLLSQFPGIGTAGCIRVHSLASSLHKWEPRPTKVATVTFISPPEAFADGENEWVLEGHWAGLAHNLIVDCHFLEFTPLNEVERLNHVLDCIAIPGLASHPFGSWKGPVNFMWLRDGLPNDIPCIRCITYGYNTQLSHTQSFKNIDDIATSLIFHLRSIGRNAPSAKPVIFLAHSLGGVILKRAFIEMARSSDTELCILKKVGGVLMFGVPSKGMAMSHLAAIVEGNPNEDLVRMLKPQSPYLSQLNEQYGGINLLRNIRLISLYETERSQLIEEASPGVLKRTAKYEVLVERSSAIQLGSASSDRIPIDRDHSSMIKYGEGDSNYSDVISVVNEICQTFTSEGSRTQQNALIVVEESPPLSSQAISNTADSLLDLEKRIKDLCSGKSTNTAPLISLLDKFKQPTGSGIEPSMAARLRKLLEQSGQQMTDSLVFSTAGLRLDTIEDPTNGTFDWIFDDPGIGFMPWLDEEQGLFWISGKPGSGKSTLMKYIYCHQITKASLGAKSSSAISVSASFFFHNRGGQYQKSYEGLLRSLLHQMLTQAPPIRELLLPMYLENALRFRGEWTTEVLRASFFKLLNQDTYSVNLRLFLDALDEFDGPPADVASFIEFLVARPDKSLTQVQVCFSSRPWAEFESAFRRTRRLVIDQYTVADIEKYVRDMLYGSNDDYKEVLTEGRLRDVQKAISEKAEGVFLWVKLVIAQIHKALVHGATFSEFEKVIAVFPAKLDDLYGDTLRRIDPTYRVETYIMLEIAARSTKPLFLTQFVTAVFCASTSTLSAAKNEARQYSMDRSQLDNLRRRISSRSGGLLETTRSHYDCHVQFMHQTVKDLVVSPGFKFLLLDNSSATLLENGFSYLAKYHLAMVEIGPEYLDSENSLAFLDYARMAEYTTGVSLKYFWDSISAGTLSKAVKVVHKSATKQALLGAPYNYVFSVNRLDAVDADLERTIPHTDWEPYNQKRAFALFSNLRIYDGEIRNEPPFHLSEDRSLLFELFASYSIRSLFTKMMPEFQGKTTESVEVPRACEVLDSCLQQLDRWGDFDQCHISATKPDQSIDVMLKRTKAGNMKCAVYASRLPLKEPLYIERLLKRGFVRVRGNSAPLRRWGGSSRIYFIAVYLIYPPSHPSRTSTRTNHFDVELSEEDFEELFSYMVKSRRELARR